MKPQTGTVEKKANKHSAMLSSEENEQVFAMLGRRCQVSVWLYPELILYLIVFFLVV